MNLKRFLLSTFIIAGSLCAEHLAASPALRQVITLKQPNGTTIQAIPMGDEYMDFMTDARTGECLKQDVETGFWRPMTDSELTLASEQWTQSRKLAKAQYRRYLGGTPTKTQIKIPVLMVQFSDLKFTEKYGSVSFYNTLLNEMDGNRLAFVGADSKEYYTASARKYFQDQSSGAFDPIFDILQPVTLDNGYAYYGNDSETAKDLKKFELIDEAVEKAIAQGDLKDAAKYDSNKDGKIDLLYIIFAGCGQNQGASKGTIWPHTSTHSVKTTDGTVGFIYCITNELAGGDPTTGTTDGIGVFVHEMSHALGLPDFYSTNSSTSANCYGMDAWSLMDQGEFNGKNQVPASYTLHERMLLGWCPEPEEVPAKGKVILEPLALNGKGLILRNPANANEYLTFEVHHKSASVWDVTWGTSSYFSYSTNNGLLITHVDYNASTWNSNAPNSDDKHQRCSPLAADGEKILYKTVEDKDTYIAFLNSFRADIYPGYNKITKLNNENPLAVWYTGENIDIDITNVVQLADGSIEITFGEEEIIGIEQLADDAQSTKPAKVELRNGRFFVNGYDLNGRKVK